MGYVAPERDPIADRVVKLLPDAVRRLEADKIHPHRNTSVHAVETW
jgi:hypothetical protein